MPKILHLGVVLQFASGLDVLDSVLYDALSELVENHGIQTLVLIVFVDGNQ